MLNNNGLVSISYKVKKPDSVSLSGFFYLKNKEDFMEFLKIKEEMHYLQRKYRIIQELEKIVTNEGYVLIEPAIFEEYETFIKINKRIQKESMVKVINSDNSILILRPDATTSIIEQVIPKWEEGLKLKLFYNTKVFRHTSKGIKEYHQFGIENLGESCDYDVVELVFKILKQFNENYLVEIGNSKFINDLFKLLNLDEANEQVLKSYIYYKNQFEINRFIERNKPNHHKILSSLLSLQGCLTDIKKKLDDFTLTDEMEAAIDELNNLQFDNAKFDLSMISQYDYYDGIIFKGYYPNTPIPIISGGRYDGLTKRYGHRIKAVGFSIDSDALIREVFSK